MPAQPPFRQGENYNTRLSLLEELEFRAWAKANRVPFDINASESDYDMRGFWRALQQQNPRAQSAVNPNDNRMHYPDYWKTPSHQSFSRESQWAAPDANRWINDSQLADRGGRVVYDEKPQGILGYLRSQEPQGILGY